MADVKTESKKAILLSATPVIENGVHAKYKESFKFTVVFNNGDVGTAFGKTTVFGQELNKEYGYTKSTSGQNGQYVNIKFDRADGNSSMNNGKSGSFSISKEERAVDRNIRCADVAANIVKAISAQQEASMDLFKEIFEDVKTVTGLEALNSGATESNTPMVPAKKVLTEQIKAKFIEYFSSNDAGKIKNAIISLADYSASATDLDDFVKPLIKPF